ncbi:MAG: type VI secretion system baseplate subunit TssF [Gemmataceae bacterium]
MSEALFPYYERELLFIRQLAQEFARQYPAAAGRLLLEPNRSTDPHVERLIESFALLSGRIHHKLDDEFPELTDALLGVLYPHYLAPIPSMAIVQFELDPSRAQLPNGFRIEQHSRLHTQPVGDLPCKFRTGYPVTLWPVRLTAARLIPPPFPPELRAPPRTAAILRMQFECQAEMNFTTLNLDKLRFYLVGENQFCASLYEHLFNHVLQVEFRSLERSSTPPVQLRPEDCLHQVGFERDESLLPYPNQSFPGYRLLTEFLTFPSKFLFFDLGGWDQLRRTGFARRAEAVFYLRHTETGLEQGVSAETFRTGCTPVVNLFEQVAEPIPLTRSRYEYRIVPDVAHQFGMEVYSIDEVTSTDPVTGKTTLYQPFYSFKHGRDRNNTTAFWYGSRRPSLTEGDRGTEVYLNLVDLKFTPTVPAEAVLVVRTTCTNRELPLRLQRAGEALSFELESAAPLARIRCLRSPSAPLRAPMRRGAYWKLVSHLSLNHLSLSDPLEGREALQEILRLYDFSDPESGQQQSAVIRQLIDGIVSVSSRRVVGRTGGPTASGFARGVEVTVEFDEQKYVGTGMFLFASVLERFLGMYASINSFSQLIARSKQGEGYIKKWPPRAAEQVLL